MDKVVLVLGAGTFQAGLVRNLNINQYKVHIVSNVPPKIDITEVDGFHYLDYSDTEQLTHLVKNLNAVQVLTAGSDQAFLYANRLQIEMRWSHTDPQLLELLIDKTHYKKRLQKKGIRVPKMLPLDLKKGDYEFNSADDGLMVKPRRGNGSKDVSFMSIAEYQNGLIAQESMFLEEYIYGEEYGGDMLVHGLEIAFYHPTTKNKNEHHVPISHLVLEQPECKSIIVDYLETVVRALDLSNGVYNVDVMVKDEQVYLIDLSGRIGGNCIPDLMLKSWGVNEWDFLTDISLGLPINKPSPRWNKPYGVYIIGSEKAGVVQELVTTENPFEKHEIEIFWSVKKDDKVQVFDQGSNHLGYIIYSTVDDTSILDLQIEIESFEWFILH